MTQRLTGLDASFLYLETPSTHMHVASLMILDPPASGEPVSLQRAKEVYGQRLHLAPPFRRRLAEVPFGLHHPVWIEDPDFDLDHHIRTTSLPAPGDAEQLASVVAELSERPLDRTRPLWEIWVIEGLAGGKVGCLSKVHHAAIDGVRQRADRRHARPQPGDRPPRTGDRLGPRPGTELRRAAGVRSHVARPPAVPGGPGR